jgi:hypothetical protein
MLQHLAIVQTSPRNLPVQVRDSLTQRASEFNILVDDVAITHLSFGTEVGQSPLEASHGPHGFGLCAAVTTLVTA